MFTFLRRWLVGSSVEGRKSIGARGERQARRYLRRRGFRILARNYRCAAGELDLIALDGGVLVFIEVRSRRSPADSDPAEWVSPGKWRQVHRVARYYLHACNAYDRPCRFDLVTVLYEGRRQSHVQHFMDAYVPFR